MENRRRWTGQGGADSSCCFWSAYHMPGSRRNAFHALSHSSHLPYATGTLNGTTDEETEAVSEVIFSKSQYDEIYRGEA